MDSRAQVDLIDMQSQPDGDLKWILVYQDHLTKFEQLRPVTSKLESEIAYQFLNIFIIFGAPSIDRVIMEQSLRTLLLLNSVQCGMV